MAIILDRPGFGAKLGSSLGGGLSSALSTLAEGKFKQMQQRQLAGQLKEGGLSEVLAYLEPQVQAQYFRGAQAAQTGAKRQEQENQLSSIMENLLGGSGTVAEGAPQLVQPEAEQQQALQPEAEQQQALQPKAEQKIQVPLSPGAKAAQEMQNLEVKLKDPRISDNQRSALRKRFEERHEKFDKKQDAIDKRIEPFSSKITTDFEAAQSGDQRLNRMRELINTGKLEDSTFFSILDSVGVPLKGALASPESQEFEKLSKDFLRDVKKIFGGSRITDNEIRQFLKTIPTLSQSDAGKLRVINNIQMFNEASKVKKEAMDSIIEENGGFKPNNLEKLVNDRTKDKLDTLAKEFESGKRLKSLEKETQRAEARDVGAGIAPLLGGALGGLGGGAVGAVPGLLLGGPLGSIGLGAAGAGVGAGVGAAAASKLRRELSNLLTGEQGPQAKQALGFLLERALQ